MGAARLLAKAWLVFCVFAGAYEARQIVSAGASLQQIAGPISVCEPPGLATNLSQEAQGFAGVWNPRQPF